MRTVNISQEDRDEVIGELLERIKMHHSASVNDVISSLREDKKKQNPNYDLFITTTLMEGICIEITSKHKNQYLYKAIQKGEFTHYIITLNPNYKKESWTERNPTGYEWAKGGITGLFTLLVGFVLLLISKGCEEDSRDDINLCFELLTKRVDSITKAQCSSLKPLPQSGINKGSDTLSVKDPSWQKEPSHKH